MRTFLLLFTFWSCSQTNAQTELTIKEVEFDRIFGSTELDSTTVYCLSGIGHFRSPSSDNIDSVITAWISKHPKAIIKPVYTSGPTLTDEPESLITYSWVIDGTANPGLELKDLIAIVIASASILISIATYVHSSRLRKKERQRVAKSTQIINLPNFLIDRYSQRLLTQPYRIKQTEFAKIKSLRNFLLTQHKRKNQSFLEIAKIVRKESLQDNTPENKLTYEISLALDEVGMMLMTGALPLIPTLQLIGLQLAEDYALCRTMIEDKIRTSNETKYKSEPEVNLHKVHGEWLSLIAFEYINNNFTGSRISHLAELYPDSINRIKKIQKIQKCCNSLLSDDIMDEVNEIIGNSINKNH